MTNKKEEKKKEENTVEEINLDEIDMEDLDFPQGSCNCSACPMNCHDDVEEIDEDK
ncbi:MAG: hypothetical protein ACLFNO_02725 [Parcubacteria group bacterium]